MFRWEDELVGGGGWGSGVKPGELPREDKKCNRLATCDKNGEQRK